MPWQERSTTSWQTPKHDPSMLTSSGSSFSFGDPNVYVGILIVAAMFYGLYRWQRWAKARSSP